MPYKSLAQRRMMHVLEAEGKVPPGTAARWEAHTPKDKKLPEHVEHKKSATLQSPSLPAIDFGNRLKVAYDMGVSKALMDMGLLKQAEEPLKAEGKETRLRKDHKADEFLATRRSFERAGKHKLEVGQHVPLDRTDSGSN